MRVVVVSHFVSPYQMELFDAIAQSKKFDLEVVYLHQTFHSRNWKRTIPLHKATYLDESAERLGVVTEDVLKTDLAVFNYYAEPPAMSLLKARASTGRPWCFWGERPGFRRLGKLGEVYRRYRLAALRRSRAPIWGMGRWAVSQYQKEFGDKRAYFNVPYFSDLDRFQNYRKQQTGTNDRKTILFSGSLIKRKGADLLVDAFARLADRFDNVHLWLIGEGHLRAGLERQIRHLGDRVKFLGFQSWEDLPRYYSKADFLCAPSRYDGWNLAIPEGLSAGLPTVASDRTGAALEFIRNGENGFLVPSGDVNELYQALVKIVQLSSQELKVWSQSASESIRGHKLANGVERFCEAAEATLRVF
jgi:glycosyltransferase involved in cell wall biosynthesis